MSTTTIAAEAALPKSVSPTWKRFRDAFRRHPTAIAGALMLLVMVAAALFAPWLRTVDPQAVAPIKRLRPPSAADWFGTDMLGRDVYSRVIYGARVSLSVGLSVALFSTLVGLAIGLVTGYRPRARRGRDAHHGRPHVDSLGAARDRAHGAHQGERGQRDRAITIAEMPRVVRLVRSLVLTLREQPYVEAAIAAGTPLPRILVRHIVPEHRGAAPRAGHVRVRLGDDHRGDPLVHRRRHAAQHPELGQHHGRGPQPGADRGTPASLPGHLPVLTVLAVNLLGDGMRDALDPRLARRM